MKASSGPDATPGGPGSPSPAALSHAGAEGEARMVDVSAKAPTLRRARAEGFVRMALATRRLIEAGEGPKGSVLGVARVAGIQAAKQTAHLIPLCHPLPVEKVRVDFEWVEAGGAAPPPEPAQARLKIEAEVVVTAKTGVEMEALTAVAVAALTVYDMAKAADPRMVIEGIRLVEKTGGKSG
ncbi:MAG: cyclic pyranopterin monophosphate synthase MoaC [Planctomycetes bacterium]|nr:cyclic pyranopterin monophosphate synthase MoaC [Planctomycetota bacterium]